MAPHSHKVTFYGLSTCVHCKRTREFLEGHHVQFELHYVDLARDKEREDLIEQVRELNPRLSFPTVVVDDDTVIIGFQEEKLSKALEL